MSLEKYIRKISESTGVPDNIVRESLLATKYGKYIQNPREYYEKAKKKHENLKAMREEAALKHLKKAVYHIDKVIKHEQAIEVIEEALEKHVPEKIAERARE